MKNSFLILFLIFSSVNCFAQTITKQQKDSLAFVFEEMDILDQALAYHRDGTNDSLRNAMRERVLEANFKKLIEITKMGGFPKFSEPGMGNTAPTTIIVGILQTKPHLMFEGNVPQLIKAQLDNGNLPWENLEMAILMSMRGKMCIEDKAIINKTLKYWGHRDLIDDEFVRCSN